jgi:hypothetical protein
MVSGKIYLWKGAGIHHVPKKEIYILDSTAWVRLSVNVFSPARRTTVPSEAWRALFLTSGIFWRRQAARFVKEQSIFLTFRYFSF